MANTTKRMLAMSLKKLLTRTTLDNITIQELVDDAEVSRKTFYYHFQDIYALLEWTLIDESRHLLAETITKENWLDQIRNVFGYLLSNRALILNAYHSLQRETLESELEKLLSPRVDGMFRLYPAYDQVAEKDQRFLTDMYAFALSGLLLRWIGRGMPDQIDPLLEQINRFFTGSFEDVIRRYLS